MTSKLKYFLFIITCFIFSIVKSQSVGGVSSGSATYCSYSNSGFITLNGQVGTILNWQSSIDAGVSWVNVANPTSTQSYLNLFITTYYRAIVQNGVFLPDTSTISIVTVHAPADGGVITGGGTYCVNSGSGVLNVTGNIGNVVNWLVSFDDGLSWTDVSNTSTSLNYSNITQNSLYVAVVENASVCPKDSSSIAEFIVDELSNSGAYLSNDSTLCNGVNGGTITLDGNIGTIQDWLISHDNGTSWSSEGNTTNELIYSGLTETSWYKTLAKNGVCPTDTTTPIKLTVVFPNPVSAGEDVTIIQFQSTTLNGTGIGAAFWSPSNKLDNPHLLNPMATPLYTTMFTVILTDSNYCLSSDSVLVTVKIPFPSAITPNNDGANDYFIIDKVDSLPNNSIEIYNRQGNVVFKESPYSNNWNGNTSSGGNLPDGIYYYLFDFGNERKPQSGYILIKR